MSLFLWKYFSIFSFPTLKENAISVADRVYDRGTCKIFTICLIGTMYNNIGKCLVV